MAITRAKSGLIVVGDSATLRSDRHWRAFIQWTKQKGCFVDDYNPPEVVEGKEGTM